MYRHVHAFCAPYCGMYNIYTCTISDYCHFSFYTARTSSPETDTVKKAGVTSPSQHTDVEMTHNPAYGPIATLKGEAQYEEVAS